jgi:hypothetical protein
MRNYDEILKQIEEQTGGAFGPAAPEDMAALIPFRLPKSVLDYLRNSEPHHPGVHGQVSLWPIKRLLQENSGCAIPGAYAVKHGYFVFATTGCGDCYCFDVRRGDAAHVPVVLISHEAVSDRTPAADFLWLAKPVARNLYEFFEQLLREEVDEHAISYPTGRRDDGRP